MVVVAFLVAYALSSPTVEIDAAVAAVEQHPGRQAVLHGRVHDASGDGVADVEVRVERPGVRAVVGQSGERGYFRVDVVGACNRYRVVLRLPESEDAATEFGRELCPGDAVEVDARLVSEGQLVWVPIR